MALAERRDADCRRIYVAEAGGLTPALINRFAREAGCYAPVDGTGLQVDMNGDFLSVHCLVPGHYDFRTPKGVLPLDLVAGEVRWFDLSNGALLFSSTWQCH